MRIILLLDVIFVFSGLIIVFLGSTTSKLNILMKKIDHIGIAVKNLEDSNVLFANLLGESHYKTELVNEQGVNTSFFKVGDSKIELLEAIEKDGPLKKFINKYGEGVHHIAFSVADIKLEISRLKGKGFKVLSDSPTRGADNKLVVFLHPKTSNGVLIELCQEIKI